MTQTPPNQSASPAWYALRRTMPPATFEDNLSELLACAARYRLDEVIVVVDTEELSHGQIPLDWLRAYLPRLHRVREALSEIGVVYSLNPWFTLGHTDRGRDGRKQIPGLQPMVGHDGIECACCACPFSEAWRRHTAEAWTLYAETRPHVVWIEDDLRMFNHLPVQYGCFCEEHLRRFSERVGEQVSREQLVAAILQPGEPHPWRGEFLALQSEAIVETAALLAQTVHRTSPESHLGIMACSLREVCLEGREWSKLAAAASDGRQLYIRPSLSSYYEGTLRGLYYSQDSIKLARHRLPSGAIELTEVENVPFTRYSKSTNFTFVEIAVSVAYGARGVTLNIFDHVGTPLESDPAFGRILGAQKAFLNSLASAAQSPGTYRGVRLLFDPDTARRTRLVEGDGFDALSEKGEIAMRMLESHGIATTYEDENVVAAIGNQLCGYSETQLRELLADDRGLLLDAPAAATIVERGLGDLIGLKDISAPRHIDAWEGAPFSTEEFFEPAFGGAKGKHLTLTLPWLNDRPSISPLEMAPGVRVVSRTADPDGRHGPPCAVAFENNAGARVFIYAYDLATAFGIGFQHPFRAEQLRAAVAWLARDAAPVIAQGDGVYPLTFRKDCADHILVGIFNLSLDPWPNGYLTLGGGVSPGGVQRLDESGDWTSDDALRVERYPSGSRLHFRCAIPFDRPLVARLKR